MPCKPEDFLSIAKQFSERDREIDWRCAISRAYYSALHSANAVKDLCPEIHVDVLRAGSHERIIQRFLKFAASTKARQIGYVLQDMRNKRESADYELSDGFVQKDALQQILTAERLQRLLAELSTEEAGRSRL